MPALPHFSPKRDAVVIRGFSPTKVLPRANAADVRAVVSALAFEHLDPGGREVTDIGNFQRRNRAITVRLDRQANTSDGAANLQVQVNDVALAGVRLAANEGTTIAQVLVPAAVYRAAFTCPQQNVRAHLVSVARSALLASYGSNGYQYSVQQDNKP